MTAEDPAELIYEYGQWRPRFDTADGEEREDLALGEGFRLARRMRRVLRTDESTIALLDAYRELQGALTQR